MVVVIDIRKKNIPEETSNVLIFVKQIITWRFHGISKTS